MNKHVLLLPRSDKDFYFGETSEAICGFVVTLEILPVVLFEGLSEAGNRNRISIYRILI